MPSSLLVMHEKCIHLHFKFYSNFHFHYIHKILQETRCSATLVTLVNFTSKMVSYINNFAYQRPPQALFQPPPPNLPYQHYIGARCSIPYKCHIDNPSSASLSKRCVFKFLYTNMNKVPMAFKKYA